MKRIERIWAWFPRLAPVSASNASRSGKPEPGPADDAELAGRLATSRSSIRRVLEEMDMDGGALLRADLHLSLFRLFTLLNDGAERFDAKDVVTCIQRLAALQKSGEDVDGAHFPGGVPDSVMDAVLDEPGVAGA